MIEVETATEKAGRLGGYELLEPLSDSFFGVRHRVRREGGGPVRAARVIADVAAGPIDDAAAALCNVRHPLLLSPIEIVRSRRQLAVITEHVEGQTVRSLVKHAGEAGEPIPPVIGVRITLDLIEALQALASPAEAAKGSSSYGGLTPDSIHVGEDGVTRLLDPGVAAAAARATRFALHPVLSAYTAPEHIDAGGDFNVRSDVFSLGVLLWEMLTCRSLFESDDYEQVCERVLNAPIPRLQREHSLRGEPIAAALAGVVAQALFRNPELRFQSYEHFASALRESGSIAEHERVAAFMRGGDKSTFELLDGEIPIDDSEVAPATTAWRSAAPALRGGATAARPFAALLAAPPPAARPLAALLAAPPPAARSLGAPPRAAPPPAARSLPPPPLIFPAPATRTPAPPPPAPDMASFALQVLEARASEPPPKASASLPDEASAAMDTASEPIAIAVPARPRAGRVVPMLVAVLMLAIIVGAVLLRRSSALPTRYAAAPKRPAAVQAPPNIPSIPERETPSPVPAPAPATSQAQAERPAPVVAPAPPEPAPEVTAPLEATASPEATAPPETTAPAEAAPSRAPGAEQSIPRRAAPTRREARSRARGRVFMPDDI